MPPAFILSQDQTLHREKPDRPAQRREGPWSLGSLNSPPKGGSGGRAPSRGAALPLSHMISLSVLCCSISKEPENAGKRAERSPLRKNGAKYTPLHKTRKPVRRFFMFFFEKAKKSPRPRGAGGGGGGRQGPPTSSSLLPFYIIISE